MNGLKISKLKVEEEATQTARKSSVGKTDHTLRAGEEYIKRGRKPAAGGRRRDKNQDLCEGSHLRRKSSVKGSKSWDT